LFTRPVAFILSGFMAAGYLMVHFPMSFPAISEAALLYCFIFLSLAAAGPVRGRSTGPESLRS
jgi:putative oxidoreductase